MTPNTPRQSRDETSSNAMDARFQASKGELSVSRVKPAVGIEPTTARLWNGLRRAFRVATRAQLASAGAVGTRQRYERRAPNATESQSSFLGVASPLDRVYAGPWALVARIAL